ncbi:MAG TPA: phenylacetate--CoA ligase family protein [Gammaproteobacteria bacterium]|nr:phenylacetate--CoA ligase family protein [Gammaproteobacteria bacterium]
MIPALSRHVVYPLQEALLRRPTFAYLRELERSQYWSREALEQLQRRKLQALLRSAAAHCPWHADRIAAAGIELDPAAPPPTLADLRRLPTMAKKDAVEHGARMRWLGVPGGAEKYNTGGSSGEPLVFYFGRWRQASDAAGRMRARRWWGVDVGEREVYLWGAPVELSKTDRIKTLRDRLLNQLVLNAFDMSPAAMDEYLGAIRAYRPRCVYGYASSVALLAAHAQARGRHLRLPGLKVVCTTGEPLYPHQRELIEQVFGVPAANEFGSRDIGFTAHETPEGQMLLMSESIILEVLNESGEPVAPGETGEAVMTGLCSEAQPFIRYRTGDVLRNSDEAAGAGRGLHVIGEVLGRSTDFVVRADGTIMHALAVIYVLRAVEGLAAFRFIQHAVDEVEVIYVTNAKWRADDQGRIARGLRARMGEGTQIRLTEVDSLPATASGKHRYVVSHVPLGGALEAARGTL